MTPIVPAPVQDFTPVRAPCSGVREVLSQDLQHDQHHLEA